MTEMANHFDLYFGGDMEAALAMCGQVAGRIDAVRPVAEIIHECAQRLPRPAGRARRRIPALSRSDAGAERGRDWGKRVEA